MTEAFEELVQLGKRYNTTPDMMSDVHLAASGVVRSLALQRDVLSLLDGLTLEEWDSIKTYAVTFDFPKEAGKKKILDWIMGLDIVKAFS